MTPPTSPVLILDAIDTTAAVDPLEVLAAVREALAEISRGTVSAPPRIAARAPDGLLGCMPAYVPGVGLAAKLVSVFELAGGRSTHDLAEVVGIVVGDEEGFAENGLAIAVGDLGVEIGRGIRDKLTHGVEVVADLGDGAVPIFGCGIGFRPISVRPFWRLVCGIPAELEYIGGGDADMFEQLPSRVR